MIQQLKNKTGFALLISILVVGVVVSVGLSLLELTIKQLALSTNSKDSETALHAANAGLECAQYWRNTEYADFETGVNVNASCFGLSKTFIKSSSEPDSGDISGSGNAYKYDVEFDWPSSPRCSKITMLVMVADNESASGVTVSDMLNLIPGYGSNSKKCESGGICTVMSVRGYNKGCGDVGDFGTIERQVLLES